MVANDASCRCPFPITTEPLRGENERNTLPGVVPTTKYDAKGGESLDTEDLKKEEDPKNGLFYTN